MTSTVFAGEEVIAKCKTENSHSQNMLITQEYVGGRIIYRFAAKFYEQGDVFKPREGVVVQPAKSVFHKGFVDMKDANGRAIGTIGIEDNKVYGITHYGYGGVCKYVDQTMLGYLFKAAGY